MHESKDNLPLLLDAPGATLRSVRCGEMTVNYAKCAAGTDFTPVLKGLKDDMCQCPHWGMFSRVRSTCGTPMAVRRLLGLARCGTRHQVTAWCDEDTDCSPTPSPAFSLRRHNAPVSFGRRSHKECRADLLR